VSAPLGIRNWQDSVGIHFLPHFCGKSIPPISPSCHVVKNPI
jgi:hypothetical protein